MIKRETTVDNARNHDCNNLPPHCVLIDRTTVFGNPFRIGQHGNRDQVIARFERYFERRIKHDVKFRKAVKKLEGMTLLCWCYPLKCHGDILAEYLNNEEADMLHKETGE